MGIGSVTVEQFISLTTFVFLIVGAWLAIRSIRRNGNTLTGVILAIIVGVLLLSAVSDLAKGATVPFIISLILTPFFGYAAYIDLRRVWRNRRIFR